MSTKANQVNLEKLLNDAVVIVKRDIRHIRNESLGGKLPVGSARDLGNYIKLLSAIIEQSEKADDEASKLTEEELKNMAKELIK